MKAHTSQFKTQIKEFGRELDSKITYTIDGTTTELGNEQLNSVTPHYEGAILKSVMKQLDIDSNVEIPVGTELNYQFGVKTRSGKNLYNADNGQQGYINNSGTISFASDNFVSDFIYIGQNTEFTISANITLGNIGVAYYNNNKIYNSRSDNRNKQSITKNTNNNYYIRFWVEKSGQTMSANLVKSYQVQLELGNQTTSYEAYGMYDYVDYGNYIVKDVEKQEDTYSWKITCYDKMLYAMKEYENSNIVFPITIRDYISAICNKLGLTFKNASEQFANYDKVLNNELYLDNEGKTLGYTFRDVLDELAGATASTICISSDDKLEIRYIHDVGELTQLTGTSFSITNSKEAQLDSFEIKGDTTQASTPTPDNPSELVSIGYENLFCLPNTDSSNNVNYTKNTDGTINLSGTASANTIFYVYKDLADTNIVNGAYYTLSANKSLPSGVEIRLESYNGTSWQRHTLGGALTSSVQTKTGTANLTSTTQIRFGIYVASGSNSTVNNLGIQLEKGMQCHNFVAYGKYGIEVKTIGKNLLPNNITTQTINGITFTINGDKTITLSNTSTAVADLYLIGDASNYANLGLKSGNYNLNGVSNGSLGTYMLYAVRNRNGSYSYFQSINTNGLIIDIQENDTFRIFIRVMSGQTVNTTIKPMLEKGSTATTYEPYQSNTYVYTLDDPLRGIGEYKDSLYIKNGYLYIERKIDKIVLDGTENWDIWNNTFYVSIDNNYLRNQGTVCICDYYKGSNNVNGGSGAYNNGNNTIEFYYPSDLSRIYLRDDRYTTKSDLKTWLSTNNTEVDYVLATPYTEQLGVANIPSTYDGITYIEITNNPTINISYIDNFDEIDEEYLKDVNVNFGEKYGAINTVVLSRSADSDKISLSQPSDLQDADKIAIQISDNQILNSNDRADYMQDILHQLYGLEYYINDYTSTGICYYDLCDRYRVNISDNSYKCIMFNDSVEITQGLQESIYTDMPDEAKEDYQYIGSDDRQINQAYILVKKNEGKIEEVISSVNDMNTEINTVKTIQTDTERTIDIISTHIDKTTGEVTEVTTTTGFTFNAEGMTISDNTTNFSALHRNTGTYYKDGDTIVGQYTKDGSKQKDLELFGVYYYGMDDIDDTPMFVAQLYNDENGEECMGHFYNRGD